MWQTYIGFIEQVLLQLSQGMARLGIPYSFGFAIILFTLVIKGLTYPLSVKQLNSSRIQQDLQPELKALREKHKDDREAFARAQMALYKEHGINPMGGCLPMLIQMPIWMGLYRSLYALAKLPHTPLAKGFLWIPSLAGPIDIVSDRPRSIDWLLPNSNHFLGWGQAIAYLILPVILVISQMYTQRMMSPPVDDSKKNPMGQMMMFMPLMFGYFSLVVPSALTLYWSTSNILGLIQQRRLLKRREALRPVPIEIQEPHLQPIDEPLEASRAATTVESETTIRKHVEMRDRRCAKMKSKRRKLRKK